MRLPSPSLDAHIEADEALLKGWKVKASQALLQALLRAPSRGDLRRRLKEVDALTDDELQRFRPKTRPIWNVAHFFMGFVVQYGLLAVIFLSGASIAIGQIDDRSMGGPGELAALIALSTICCLVLVAIWYRLYLRLWFAYLRWLPGNQTPNAGSWLAGYTTCWQFSSRYWRMMERLYVERYRA